MTKCPGFAARATSGASTSQRKVVSENDSRRTIGYIWVRLRGWGLPLQEAGADVGDEASRPGSQILRDPRDPGAQSLRRAALRSCPPGRRRDKGCAEVADGFRAVR